MPVLSISTQISHTVLGPSVDYMKMKV
jgi:hypothetical protein